MLHADPPAADTQPEKSAAATSEDQAKEHDIRRLLELTGSGKLGVQIAGQMLDQFRHSLPDVPAEFWDQVKLEMKPQELNNMIVPIYAKHFTDSDIQELIKFYESPVGKKLVASLPQVTQEAMAAGQQWGQNVARKVQERLKAKGYLQT